MELFNPTKVANASQHLSTVDPVIADLIKRVGLFTLKPEKNRFQVLVRSILSQQISVSAARSIRKKLELKLKPKRISPQSMIGLSLDDLREIGCSRQKGSYLLHLAQHVVNRQLKLNQLHLNDDQYVIKKLTEVKGIGPWTAQMFLIFTLGRENVFPIDDLGIIKSIHELYGFREKQKKHIYLELAKSWEPYCSVATLYLWRHADIKAGYAADPDKGYPV